MLGLRRLPNLGLRYQVVAGVAVGLAVLLGLFGLLAFRMTRDSTEIALAERLKLARSVAAGIDALLDHGISQLGRAAAVESFSGAPQDRVADLERLRRLHHLIGTFDTLTVNDADGAELLAWPPGSGAEWLGEGQAAVVASALATGGSVPIATPEGAADHPPAPVVAVPLTPGAWPARALVGTLHLYHNRGWVLPALGQGEGSAANVIDADGFVLASSAGVETRRQDPHLAVLGPLLAAREPGVVTHEENGGHIVAFAPLRTLTGGVVLEEREDLVLTIPRALQRTLLVLGIAAVLLASLGAWIHARWVTRPLAALETATGRLAEGKLSEPLLSRRRDEIGRLTRSFERMRSQLAAAHEQRQRWEQELERRVRSRTREVRRLLARIISAQEEERGRLARELHDVTAQTLATVLVAVQGVYDSLPGSASPERGLLARVRDQVKATLDDTRRLIFDLRPSALDDLGFVPALRAWCEDRLAVAHLPWGLTVEGQERRLDSAVETGLFRILQEAVNNVLKHAQAHSLTIRLRFGATGFVAEVEDDGQGFTPVPAGVGAAAQGLGLNGMQERADLLGARLSIRSQPGDGTVVRVELPNARAEEDDEG